MSPVTAALTSPVSLGGRWLPSTLGVTPAHPSPAVEGFPRSGSVQTPGCARDWVAALGTGVVGAVALTGLPERQHSSVPAGSAAAEVAGIKRCPAPTGNTQGHAGKACGDVRTAGTALLAPHRQHCTGLHHQTREGRPAFA